MSMLMRVLWVSLALIYTSLFACSGTDEDASISLANQVALSAKQTYLQINDAWSYPAPGQGYTTTSAYWKAQADYAHLRLNISHLSQVCAEGPLDFCLAYNSLLTSPSTLECRLAVQLARAMALRACLGDRHFNTLCAHLWKRLSNTDSRGDFFDKVASHFWKFEPFQEAKMIGASLYVTNLDDYLLRTPEGSFRGHNLICVGEDLFMGFGDIFNDGPVGSEVIWRDLHAAYADSTMSYDVFCAKQERCQERYQTMGLLDEMALASFIKSMQDCLWTDFDI